MPCFGWNQMMHSIGIATRLMFGCWMIVNWHSKLCLWPCNNTPLPSLLWICLPLTHAWQVWTSGALPLLIQQQQVCNLCLLDANWICCWSRPMNGHIPCVTISNPVCPCSCPFRLPMWHRKLCTCCTIKWNDYASIVWVIVCNLIFRCMLCPVFYQCHSKQELWHGKNVHLGYTIEK